jgi:hypothetical protein
VEEMDEGLEDHSDAQLKKTKKREDAGRCTLQMDEQGKGCGFGNTYIFRRNLKGRLP